MPLVAVNFVLFQLGWLACVLAGAGEWHGAGTALVIALVTFHLSRTSVPRDELALILSAVLFGAIGGPFAYYAGHQLGAVEMADPVAALTVLAIGWAILMPVLSRLAQQFDGFNRSSPA